MKLTLLDEAVPGTRNVAVGTFDGLHAGHRAVIGDADTILTFDPHPLEVLAPEHAPGLLTSTSRKAQLASELGVGEMVVIPFDRAFASQGPQAFIDDVLVRRLGAKTVRVGENFRFGKGADGDPELLSAQPEFETVTVGLLERDGRVVSSSWIRELLGEGDLAGANSLLESRFELDGTVIRGEQRGRELGYPTANLEPDPRRCLPAYGVYSATAVLADGDEIPAAVSIGTRPTFDSQLGELIEAHLIDFDGDLYGSELKLRFQHRMRPELEFDDAGALIEQMEKDVAGAKSLLAGE